MLFEQMIRVKKYDELKHYIFSFAKDAGLDRYIDYDEESHTYYPNLELEEDGEIEQYMDDYNDENFWGRTNTSFVKT